MHRKVLFLGGQSNMGGRAGGNPGEEFSEKPANGMLFGEKRSLGPGENCGPEEDMPFFLSQLHIKQGKCFTPPSFWPDGLTLHFRLDQT